MKRITLILIIILIYISNAFSVNFEIKAGYQAVEMKDYNKKITEINEAILLPGYTAEIEKTLAGVAAEISLIFKLSDFFDIYSKLWLLPDILFKGKYSYPNGSKFMDYKANTLFIYPGIGFNLNLNISKSFLIFFGADAGVQMGFGNNRIITYDTYGDEQDYINKYVDYYNFGFSVKTGIKYFLSQNYGLILECNYNNIAEGIFAGAGLYILFEEKDK